MGQPEWVEPAHPYTGSKPANVTRRAIPVGQVHELSYLPGREIGPYRSSRRGREKIFTMASGSLITVPLPIALGIGGVSRRDETGTSYES